MSLSSKAAEVSDVGFGEEDIRTLNFNALRTWEAVREPFEV